MSIRWTYPRSFTWHNRSRQRWYDGAEAWLRWRIAEWFAAYRKGQCWATWVMWAIDGNEPFTLPWQPEFYGGVSSCKDDSRRSGCCYCGKLQCDKAVALLAVSATEDSK